MTSEAVDTSLCKKGLHDMTGDNVIESGAKRRCRACRQDSKRKYNDDKKHERRSAGTFNVLEDLLPLKDEAIAAMKARILAQFEVFKNTPEYEKAFENENTKESEHVNAN